MIKALFGPSTTPGTLRQGLDRSMAAHQTIADRIARAFVSSNQASDAAGGGGNPNSIVADMAELADVQIRYEAEATLLRAVYETIRGAIRG